MKRKIELIDWTAPLFDKTNRYCVIHGGRGSGKSYNVSQSLLLMAYNKKSLILCGREFQNSIKDSVHSLLKLVIDDIDFSKYFTVTLDEIRCNHNGSRFIFKGLRNNIDSIKSMAGITHLWIEEGDTLSEASWRVIKPTIREENSQIFITFNPKYKDDCIYKEFVANIPPDGSYVKEVNWSDNPYFTSTLNKERLNDLARDEGLYRHVWEGALLEHSDAQIFHRKPKLWFVEEFEEEYTQHAYYGLDFGYSVDPTAGVRSYVKHNNLYITHEFYKLAVEIDDIGKKCEEVIPGFKMNRVIADSARPETISFMKRQGYQVQASVKGKGSIEDGIGFLRSFDRIIIHPRCKNTINEFNLYSYKVDLRSGEISTDIIDNYNHIIDALRYSLERLLKNKYANLEALTRMR